MHLRHHRSMSILAATAAALALGAAPALAGENDDDGDDDEVTPTAPAPSTGSSGSSGSVPQGGVATGAGGMAEQGSEAVLLGLASGALFLVLSGGRLVATARRD
jgi:hypothetical protein